MRGRAFARFLIKTAHERLAPDPAYFIVINPADLPVVVKYLDPWLDENTHQNITPNMKGILRLYGDLESRAPKGHTFCTHPLCPRGHLFITFVPPNWHYAPNRIMSRDNPAIWSWPDLEHIAREWPYLAPEYAALVYPRPPEAFDLKASEKALLARAIDHPALTHWKSAALRSIIRRKYAEPLPERGQGWYKTTALGCKALKVWRSQWARLLDDG